MGTLDIVGQTLIAVFSWDSVLAMLLGTLIGIVVGALPGLGATTAIALAIPFTYGLSPLAALGLLAGIHNGTSQGGAVPAILLRIPGTPGSIVTCWDGYPLARQGHAGAAIKLAAVSSAVGGMAGAASLGLFAPMLASVALAFGPAEIFWVNVFGLASVAALLGNDMVKGILAASFGLLLGTIGIDNVTGQERYVFGSMELLGGIPELVVMVGMFSLPPAWAMARRTMATDAGRARLRIVHSRIWTVLGVYKAWIRASIIGIIVGILPGSGGGAFIAYDQAKRAAREPEKFGRGSTEGLAAAESVNNADNAAAMIPALTLGVPGSGVAALMLGALLIHGFQPGPHLFREHPETIYGYTLQMFLTSILLIAFGGVVASRIFAQILRIPELLLLPLIVCITVAGTFAYQNSMFDVYQMFIFGLIGLGMERLGFPIAPVIIGLILGAKAEFSLRIALLTTAGDVSILFSNPICQVLILLTLLVLCWPFFGAIRTALRRSRRRHGPDGSRG